LTSRTWKSLTLIGELGLHATDEYSDFCHSFFAFPSAKIRINSENNRVFTKNIYFHEKSLAWPARASFATTQTKVKRSPTGNKLSKNTI